MSMQSGLSKRLRWLWLALLPLVASVSAEQGSRFDRTLVALQAGTQESRATFVDIALAHLAAAYAEEAERAQVEPSADGQLSLRWSQAVQRYANQLEFARMSLEQGLEPSIALSPLAEATVSVAGQTLMLTHPRPDQQAVYEQQVLESFCQQLDCGSLTGDPSLSVAEAPPRPAAAITDIRPQWSFSVDGSSCSYEGIQLLFQAGDHSGVLRKVCMALFQQASELLTLLNRQQQYGVMIEWRQLALLPSSQAEQQTLQLNAAGDVILLQMPLLYEQPRLLKAIIPWLTARLTGQNYHLSLQAKNFGWQDVSG